MRTLTTCCGGDVDHIIMSNAVRRDWHAKCACMHVACSPDSQTLVAHLCTAELMYMLMNNMLHVSICTLFCCTSCKHLPERGLAALVAAKVKASQVRNASRYTQPTIAPKPLWALPLQGCCHSDTDACDLHTVTSDTLLCAAAAYKLVVVLPCTCGGKRQTGTRTCAHLLSAHVTLW